MITTVGAVDPITIEDLIEDLTEDLAIPNGQCQIEWVDISQSR